MDYVGGRAGLVLKHDIGRQGRQPLSIVPGRICEEPAPAAPPLTAAPHTEAGGARGGGRFGTGARTSKGRASSPWGAGGGGGDPPNPRKPKARARKPRANPKAHV